MKMTLGVINENEIVSTVNEPINMKLSENASAMVFQLFTKNVYSNPIGTICREITSNCFDSHVEANVNKPVIIRKTLDTLTDTHYISFIDFGVGMSPDRVKNVYGIYFESTKKVDNNQIGGYGIGGKSVLAYKRSTGFGDGEYDNSFNVVTIFNGIKYNYCIYEGNQSPVISLMSEEETTEGNGTEIRVPVLKNDVSKFAKELVRQLYYFENIIFEGFEDEYFYGSTLTNEYQIVQGNNFLYRGKEYSEYIHICLGRVAYPIDFNLLGLSSSDFKLPLAIRLNIGDINVTVSRENIDYSETTIKMLKAKLVAAKEEVLSLLIKQYDNVVTLEQYFNARVNYGSLLFNNGMSMYAGNLIKLSEITFNNFKYKEFDFNGDKTLFNLFFTSKEYGLVNRHNASLSFNSSYKDLKTKNNLVYIEGDILNRKMIKQSYLKSKFGTYHVIKKNDLMNTPMYDLRSYVKNFTEDKTELLIQMHDEYFQIVRDNAINYDEFIVPEEFIISKKRKRNLVDDEIRKLTIPVSFTGRRDGKYRVKLDDLFKYKMPIFWGNEDDSDLLLEAVDLFKILFKSNYIVRYYNETNLFTNDYTNYYKVNDLPKQSIMFIKISKGNTKYMKYCNNANHISTFKTKMAYRKNDLVDNIFSCKNLLNSYNNDLDALFKDKDFSILNDKWGDIIKELNTFISTIPVAYRNSDIYNRYSLINNFYNVNGNNKNKEYSRALSIVNELWKLQESNKSILDNLRVYNNIGNMNETLISILKKVMVF